MTAVRNRSLFLTLANSMAVSVEARVNVCQDKLNEKIGGKAGVDMCSGKPDVISTVIHAGDSGNERKTNNAQTKMCTQPVVEHCCGSTWVEEVKRTVEAFDCHFRCGGCQKKFQTICRLHKHLKVYHKTGGSYHYDDVLQTAFPKYESFCRFTQTEEEVWCRDEDFDRQEDDMDTSEASAGDCPKQFKTEKSQLDVVKSPENFEDEISSLEDRVDKCGESLNLEKSDDAEGETKAKISEVIKKHHEGGRKLARKKSRAKRDLKTSGKDKSSVKAVENQMEVEECGTDDNSKSSSPVEDLDRPIKSEDKSGGFSCELCDATFKNNSSLVRHEKTKHAADLKVQCMDCDRKFMREKDLNRHRTYAHSQVKPKKEVRDFSDGSPKVSNSGEHADVGNKGDTEHGVAVTEHEYALTDKDSKAQKKLRSKEEIMHLKVPYTCELCGHIMPRSKMKIHQRIHTGERPYICDLCGKGLISADKLKRHMLTHDKVKKHKCDVCGVGFQMRYKLKMHMHIHTGKKPYLCSVCGAEFNHSSNLTNHIRCVHRQVKPFECDTCHATFARRSQLDDHVYSHSTEKQFTCRFCGKSFKYLKGMRRHEKAHMDSKTEYPCDKCELKFHRKDTFERHKLVHAKDNTLQCCTCGLVVKDQKELAEHVKTHVVKTVYECLLCNEKFKAEHYYYTHMLVSHEMNKDVAKLVLTKKRDKQVVKMLAKNATVLDPNLPLPADQSIPAVTGTDLKTVNSVSSSFNVDQVVSSILDENKETLNAMTRVATENLCLHSQDIGQEEKVASLLPPANPLSSFEKGSRIMPLDHLGHNAAFGMQKKPTQILNGGPTEISDHAYGQRLSHSQNSLVNQLGIQQDSGLVGSLAQLPATDSHSAFSNAVAVLDIGSLTSFIGQRSHSNLTPLSGLGSQTGMQTLEQGAIESLRRLQDTSDPPVSVTSLDVMLHQRQTGAPLTGSALDREATVDNVSVGYRIQNLF